MKRVLLVIGAPLENAGVPNVVMKIVRMLHNEFIFDILVGKSQSGCYDEEFLSYGGNIYCCDRCIYEDGKLQSINSEKYMKKTMVAHKTSEIVGERPNFDWQTLIFNQLNKAYWCYKGEYYAI